MTEARYFDRMICQSVSGLVSTNSILPVLNSSEKLLIVTAGARKIKTQGARTKRVSILLYPASSRLNCPGKIHMNNAIANRKRLITMYPISEFRKLLISF
jgi:hypothetical protein